MASKTAASISVKLAFGCARRHSASSSAAASLAACHPGKICSTSSWLIQFLRPPSAHRSVTLPDYAKSSRPPPCQLSTTLVTANSVSVQRKANARAAAASCRRRHTVHTGLRVGHRVVRMHALAPSALAVDLDNYWRTNRSAIASNEWARVGLSSRTGILG
jgi:hypothetical protein